MNYEEKYKQALERARHYYLTGKGETVDFIKMIFPELAESEDERIRKEIIDFLGMPHPQFVGKRDHEKWIAWLEKLEPIDKDKLAKGFLRSVATTIMQYLDTNTAEGKMCLSNMECEDIENAVFNADWAKVYRYMKKKLEKQGEQNFDYEHADIPQKDFAPIEPKFKVGDWISGYYTNYKVTAINSKGYVVEDIDGNKINILFENEKFHHLWAIQDARDGDVLVASDGSIFLFAGVDDCACKYYVALTADNYLKINKETKGGYWETSRAVHPATKKQRDLLFQKMADAGYEWDGEKKGLKKIESKTLDTAKVIEWIECEEFQGWAEPIDIRPIIRKFKKDFGL